MELVLVPWSEGLHLRMRTEHRIRDILCLADEAFDRLVYALSPILLFELLKHPRCVLLDLYRCRHSYSL